MFDIKITMMIIINMMIISNITILIMITISNTPAGVKKQAEGGSFPLYQLVNLNGDAGHDDGGGDVVVVDGDDGGDSIQYEEDKDGNDGCNGAKHLYGDDADHFDGKNTNDSYGNVADDFYDNDADDFVDCLLGGGDLYDLMKKCQQVRNFKVQNHS